MALVEDGYGGWEIIGEREPLAKPVAWRVPMSDYADMLTFIETFPERTLSTAMRWLWRHPDVQKVIMDKIRSASTRVEAE